MQQPGDYWGKSMFDESVATPEQYADIGAMNDTRAENQPLLAKWGSALGNGVVLAGTTFLDGTLGLLYGGGKAAVKGSLSELWDNEISNGLQDFNRYA